MPAVYSKVDGAYYPKKIETKMYNLRYSIIACVVKNNFYIHSNDPAQLGKNVGNVNKQRNKRELNDQNSELLIEAQMNFFKINFI